MLLPKLLPAFLLGATALVSQQTNPAYAGETWTGLLVSADCGARTKSDREANLTMTDRVTTPAVDNAGSRGDDTPAPTATTATPRTGDLESTPNPPAGASDPGWRYAKQQAARLPKTCRVGASATKFALLLPGGKMLPFDQLANQKIAAQLSSAGKVTGAPRLLRVLVVGKVENGAIALDTIQM